MATRFCTQCGGPNPANATFCQYCGKPLAGAPAGGAPPVGGAPPPAGPLPAGGWAGAPGGYGAPPPPPPRRRHTILRIFAILIVIVLIASILVYLFVPVSTPNVDITEFVFVSPDNVCGLNGVGFYGFNTTPGQAVNLTVDLTGAPIGNGNATLGCTLGTLTTTTSGFSVSDANVPLVIPANATEILAFTLGVPSSSYTGNVTLVAT